MFRKIKKSPQPPFFKGGVLILLVVLFAACAKDLVTGKSSYNFFGVSDDVQMGQEVLKAQMDEMRKKGTPLDNAADAEMTQKVREITRRIAAVSHYPNFPYEAHYAKMDVVNAWCAPGGKIMVYSGLMNAKKGLVRPGNDHELAAVLGHEISHATARHVAESVSRASTLSAVGQVAVSAIGGAGAATQDLFSQVIVGGLNLYLPSYSRKNESEADRIGLIYMAKAGYNPQAAVDLWYRACKTEGDQFSLTASHPSNCSRAKDLQAVLPEAMKLYNQAKK